MTPQSPLFSRWFFAALLAALPATSLADDAFFEKEVRPLLVQHCGKCHGQEKQESGLRVDSRESLLSGGASGEKAVVPGDPGASFLLKAVRHEGDVHMPPDEKLAAEQVAVLDRWIADGAPWPATGNISVLPIKERALRDRREHWAFQTVAAPVPPETANRDWPAGPIDRFVLAELERAGVAPSPEADKGTLVRRLAFDLTGLPPTMEEIESFAADESPDAYERLVDRLLASPAFGERWGRHWLDLARYGDTKGYAFTNDRRYPYAYTYRDYVVGSFNGDLPYDVFLKQQLAADLLPLASGETESRRPSLAALGFLTVGRKFNNRNDDLDDQIDVVTRGLQGLTVSCARCHDHKYDGVPMGDYYALYGVFAGSGEPEMADLPLIGEPDLNAAYAVFEQELNKKRAAVDAYLNERRHEILTTARERVADYLVRVHDAPGPELLARMSFLLLKQDDIREPLLRGWKEYLDARAKPGHPLWGFWAETKDIPVKAFAERAPAIVEKWKGLPEGASPGQCDPILKAALAGEPLAEKHDVSKLYGRLLVEAWKAWQEAGGDAGAIEKLPESRRPWASALVAADSPTGGDNPRRYLRRDERNRLEELRRDAAAFEASSPEAPPRAMIVRENGPFQPRVFIRGNPNRPGDEVPRQWLLVVAGENRAPFASGGGRLDLAESIAAADNPLTRRVFANRVWMHLFGEPLVDTPSDFGVRTEKPVHAALLDWLSASMLEDGWSIKSLVRRIVVSRTYRQASAARADAAAADPENRLWHRANRKRLEWEAARDAMLAASGRIDRRVAGRTVDIVQPESRRRTLYGTIDRQDLPNLFRVFDLPSPDTSAAKRPRTTTPQQSLFLMNSPFMVHQATDLASRKEVVTAESDSAKATALFRAAIARDPRGEELHAALAFVSECRAEPLDAGLDPWQQLAQTLLLTNEFVHVD